MKKALIAFAFAILLIIASFSTTILYLWMDAEQHIITAEEYLLHPNYYQVDTLQTNGVTIYIVHEL